MRLLSYLLVAALLAFPAPASKRHDGGSSGFADTTQRMWFINDATVDLGGAIGCQGSLFVRFDNAATTYCTVGAGMRVQFIKMGAQITLLTSMDDECRICLNVDDTDITTACITVGDDAMDALDDFTTTTISSPTWYTEGQEYRFVVLDSSGGGTCTDGVTAIQILTFWVQMKSELDPS